MNLHLINVALPLHRESSLFEIQVQNGNIVSINTQEGIVINPEFTGIGQLDRTNLCASIQKWDVEGRIMMPPFVDAHMHLDKAYCLPQVPNHSGTLTEAVFNYHAASSAFSLEEMKGRMLRTALQALSYGTTTIRTHIDFLTNRSGTSVFTGIKAALEVKEQLAPYIAVQIVPMCPLCVGPKEIDMIEEALLMGADAIGGAPHLSPTADHDIDQIFKLASKFNRVIDLHTDESDDPMVNTLATIIDRTKKYGYEGKVVVDHLCSLSAMDDAKATPLIEQIVKNDIGVITLPASNFYLQGRNDRGIVRRGLTRVKEMLSAGVSLATASDNLHDPFHPYGRGDLLQMGLLTGYGAHLGSSSEQKMLMRMITDIPARLLGMKHYGIDVGREASFVLLDAYRVEEILTMLPEGRWIYKGGRWLNVTKRQLQWGNQSLHNLWRDSVPPGAYHLT